MELEYNLSVLRCDGEVDIALFSGADFVPQPSDNLALFEAPQRQNVVSRVGEAVSVVAAALVVAEKFVAEERAEDFGGASVAEVGDGGD